MRTKMEFDLLINIANEFHNLKFSIFTPMYSNVAVLSKLEFANFFILIKKKSVFIFRCEHPCKDGTYGPGCSYKCTCENAAECSHINGHCQCAPGKHYFI